MADQTQNYAFSLPEVDGSEDLWGDLLNQNWSDLDALLKVREDEVGSLTGRVTTAEGDINALDGRVTTAEGDINTLDDRVSSAEGDINALDGRVTTAEGDINALDGRVTTAEGDIDDLDDRVSSAAKLSGGADANFTVMPQVGGSPIVESGSNSDGAWTRLADGTQQCRGARLVPGGSGDHSDSVWDFPVAFINSGNPASAGNAGPYVTASVSTLVPGTTVQGWSSHGETTTQATLMVLRTNSTNTWVVATATGRWK